MGSGRNGSRDSIAIELIRSQTTLSEYCNMKNQTNYRSDIPLDYILQSKIEDC